MAIQVDVRHFERGAPYPVRRETMRGNSSSDGIELLVNRAWVSSIPRDDLREIGTRSPSRSWVHVWVEPFDHVVSALCQDDDTCSTHVQPSMDERGLLDWTGLYLLRTNFRWKPISHSEITGR